VEEEALGVDHEPGGDLLVVGRSASLAGGPAGAFVLRLDGAGNAVWRRDVPGFEPAAAIEARANGAIAVAGTWAGHPALLDLDAAGDLLWARIYPAGAAGTGAAVVNAPDGGLFLAASASAVAGGAHDLVVTKTDPQGRVGCGEVDVFPTVLAAAPHGGFVPLNPIPDLGVHDVLGEIVGVDLALDTPCDVQRVTPACAGDGSLATACPCGNTGGPGRGCASSVEPLGAFLDGVGDPAADTLALAASGLPSIASPAVIFFQGDQVLDDGVVFGDGVRCADGLLVRLATKPSPSGQAAFPDAGDPLLSLRGGVVPGSGDLRWYQAYYRNAAASFCPPATFNVTSALRVLW
jgi:hypothetical protein